MFSLSKIFLLALALSTAQAAPLHTKRIAQVITAATQKWEQACLAAGGGQKCNPISITAFSTLLAAPGPCEQQNAADQMIDLAKQLNNDAQMIKLAQIFRQQPRNTPSSESVQYCQQAPKNSELSGLFQCQFAGAKAQTFVGGVPVGSPGTIPFGLSSPLNPAGSCPASPNGPIPDGQQLVDITQNPGSVGGGVKTPPVLAGNQGNQGNQDKPANACTPDNNKPANDKPANNKPADNKPANNKPANNKPAPAPPANTQAGGFKLQNGKDAQKLNAQFATLTANSSCTAGQNACVDGGFAQCVGGSFVVTQCGPTLVCAALPLVNSPGTSITCTTKEDAITRIGNTGAQGGLTGSG